MSRDVTATFVLASYLAMRAPSPYVLLLCVLQYEAQVVNDTSIPRYLLIQAGIVSMELLFP